MRILNELRVKNPNVKFLLENVKMKRECQNIISNILGVELIEINSALLSAQNRRRLYWTNIEGIEQPKDRGIMLKDIILMGGNFKYPTKTRIKYITTRKEMGYTKGIIENGDSKAPCLMASMYKNLVHHTINHNYVVYGTAQKGKNIVGSTIKDGVIRFITPIECERLQTVPDNYTSCVSDSQRYKMLGNG